MQLAGEGLTDKEIARKLGITPGTVRTYWERMRQKTNARSRAEVISKHAAHESAEVLEWARAMSASLAHHAILTVHVDLTIGVLNDRAAAFLCCDAEQVVGLKLTDLLKPEDDVLVSHA